MLGMVKKEYYNKLNDLWTAYEIYMLPIIFVMLVIFRNIDMGNIFPYVMVWFISVPLYARFVLSIRDLFVTSRAMVGNWLIVIILLTVGFSSTRTVILSNFGNVWIWYFFVPYATLFDGILLYKYRRNSFITAMRILNLIIFATAIIGVLEHLYNAYYLMDKSYRITTVYSNTFMHGTLCLYAIFLPEFSNKTIVRMFSKLLYIYNIIFTFSRNIWLSLVIVLMLHITCHRREVMAVVRRVSSKKIFLIATAALGILLIVFFLASGSETMNALADRFKIDKEGSSYTVRTTYAKYFFEKLLPTFNKKELLIGRGTRTSRVCLANSNILISIYEAFDNMYITTFFEYGILGLLLIVIVMYRTIYVIIKSQKISFLYNLENVSYSFSMLCLSAVIPAFFYELYDWHSVMIVLTWGWAVVFVEYNEMLCEHSN